MMRCCEQQAEVRASFVVGIPSDRSVCIKQVLIEGEQLAKEDLELITPRGRYIGPIRQPPEETTYIERGKSFFRGLSIYATLSRRYREG